MRKGLWAVVAALSGVLLAVVGRVLRTAGATGTEAAATLPGDDVLVDPVVVSTRARTLPAPPQDVWPWLVQLGYGRAGWYAIDELEALLGVARSTTGAGVASWRSLWHVEPAHQDLAVGDVVPLAPWVGLDVHDLVADEHLVLVLRTGGGVWSFDWCWSWVLTPVGDGATRLVVRTSMAARPAPVAAAVAWLLDPGHAVMELVQLRNLHRRIGAGRH